MMTPDLNNKIQILKSKILLVEGKDEIELFTCLFDHLQINNVEILDYKGKSKFHLFLPPFTGMENFDAVTALGVFRDADNDSNAAFDSIADTLKMNNLPRPSQNWSMTTGIPKVGIGVIPANQSQGMLEDICLQSIENHPNMDCVNKYMQCIKTDAINWSD
jgi:hypothetical protein